jgi:cytochrome oxidase Cu insertion factor (SCO1/SenC/PrrC family)
MLKSRNMLIGIVAALVLVGVLLYLSTSWLTGGVGGAPELPAIAVGGPFSLEASDGRTVTDQTYRGKWQLIYFGYTLCPDACPTALNDIAGALERLGPEAAEVQPLFITVDPARDTPKVMGEYVKAFDPRIIGLTGSPEAIAAAARNFRVYYAKVADKDAPDGYLMDHSSVIYVMRPGDFKFVATFTHETTSDEMADRLKKLIGTS